MQTFKKEERLCNKIIIEKLFSTGKSFTRYPFSVKWDILESSQSNESKILINVPKRFHKNAVDRNLLKRRIKEAYRKNKHVFLDFLEKNNICMVFSLVYNSKEIASFKDIELKIILILQRFQKEYEKTYR